MVFSVVISVKSILFTIIFISSFSCLAENSLLTRSVKWVVDALPEDTMFDVASDGLKFSGCKHRDYQMRITQPINPQFSIETSLGYSKGQLQWGVFSQKVSVYELSLVPRYQVSERLSLGFGMVSQSDVKFKTTQGLEFDLPSSQEWLASSRIHGIEEGHYWELMVSSKKWQTNQSYGSWFERGLADNKLTLSYNGSF